MKTKIIYLTLMAAMLSLGACSNNDGEGNAPKYITVTANISQPTRTATAADGTQTFVAGDAISVYVWTGSATTMPTKTDDFVVSGSVNTYNGSSWVANPQMLWKNLTTPHFFLAVFPARNIHTEAEFTLDVSKQEQNDVLVGTNFGANATGVTPTLDAIPLTFDHIMAKLHINVQYRNQWGADGPSESSVSVPMKTTADIDFLNKSTSPTGNAVNITLPTINTSEGFDKSWESIVIPQAGFNTVTVNIEGHDYVYEHPTDILLENGKVTTVNLVVGRNEIILGSISINPWIQGVIIGEETPEEVTD